MTIALESMAVEMPVVEGHPNRAAFRGVLTVVDAPSQRAPSGSGGRRVVLTRKAAEDALPSLMGMALDYAPSFDRHDVRRKVGVITSADVVGQNLEVGGYLYAKDFPDIVAEIAKCGRRGGSTGRLKPKESGCGLRWRQRWSGSGVWRHRCGVGVKERCATALRAETSGPHSSELGNVVRGDGSGAGR